MISTIEIYNLLNLVQPDKYAASAYKAHKLDPFLKESLTADQHTEMLIRRTGRTTRIIVDMLSYMSKYTEHTVAIQAPYMRMSEYIKNTALDYINKINNKVGYRAINPEKIQTVPIGSDTTQDVVVFDHYTHENI